MKNKIQIFILTFTLAFAFICNTTYASTKNSVDEKSLKVLLSKEKLSNQEVDGAYNELARMIDNKANLTMKDLLELCILYSQHDLSDAPYEFANSLKKSNPKEFEKALKSLSEKDRATIERFIYIAEQPHKILFAYI